MGILGEGPWVFCGRVPGYFGGGSLGILGYLCVSEGVPGYFEECSHWMEV